MNNPHALRCEISAITNLHDVAALWLTLEEKSTPSFYCSWAWVGSWLALIKGDVNVEILKVYQQDELVGLGCLVAQGKIWYLNEAGLSQFDALYIEHNKLLVKTGLENEVFSAALSFLLIEKKYRLRVSGIDAQTLQPIRQDEWLAKILHFDVSTEGHFYYIDLHSSQPYIDTLSKNTRYQIRRSLREYSAKGDVQLTFAQDLFEAKEFFERLCVLHAKYWSEKGVTSDFLSDFGQQFHWQLICEQLASGAVNLIKISVENYEIGYLYTFVKNGTVSVYQSGFHYDSSKHFKPGLVSHYLAIEHYKTQGACCYDLLAGDGQYKRSLATGKGEMIWLVVAKNSFGLRLQSMMKRIKSKLSAWRA